MHSLIRKTNSTKLTQRVVNFATLALLAGLAACGDNTTRQDASTDAPVGDITVDQQTIDTAIADTLADSAASPMSWTATQSVPGSFPAFGGTAVHDTQRGRLIYFGGRNAAGLAQGTWSYSNNQWTELSVPQSYTGRLNQAAAYDAQRDRVVVFGGLAQLGPPYPQHSDTWEFDGTTWTQSPHTGPSARLGHAMAYDAARQEVVMFGGADPFAPDAGHTWVFDGSSWTDKTPTGASPSTRINTRMAYDEALQQVVLFGGQSSSGLTDDYNDTWVWDGSSWTELAPANKPPGRGFHAMTWHPARNAIVMFGGSDEFPPWTTGTWFDKVWTFQAGDWSSVEMTGNGPAGRTGHTMCSLGNAAVLVGGTSALGLLAEAWVLDQL